jgi:Fur family ferric uptake transcriptional regulator/Fur family peroxide stress response transcriptional regulator
MKEVLLAYGVKPSLQRMAVMDYLVNHPIHPTADMIFNELYPSIPTLSKTTVYNTLKLLEESGAIQSITIDAQNVRYDANLTPHSHFRCTKCGCIEDLFISQPATMALPQSNKMLITDYQVYYKGYCEKCK